MGMIHVAVLTYVRPLEEIDREMAAHAAWLDKGYADGTFIASGRRVPRNGGVILCRGDSVEAIRLLMREDPFQRLGLATLELIPFDASRAADALRELF